MAQKSYTGSCLCQAITYRVDLPADQPAPKVILCHCISCKRYSGSGFTSNIIVPKPSFQYTSGQPKFHLDDTDRGTKVRREFCGDCGTTLISDPDPARGVTVIKTGTLDAEARANCGELQMEIYYSRKDKWVDGMKDEGITRFDGMP